MIKLELNKECIHLEGRILFDTYRYLSSQSHKIGYTPNSVFLYGPDLYEILYQILDSEHTYKMRYLLKELEIFICEDHITLNGETDFDILNFVMNKADIKVNFVCKNMVHLHAEHRVLYDLLSFCFPGEFVIEEV